MSFCQPLRRLIAAVGLAGLLGSAAAAGFLDHEVSFSEAQVQAAIDQSKPFEKHYGGLITVALPQPPKITLGAPVGRATLVANMLVTLPGQPAVPVEVLGDAGIRYDDQAKAFFLESPQATSVSSPALQRNAEPLVRQAITQLMVGYFRSRPVYVLRDNASLSEATARWLLRAVRIEPGRVVATLGPS